ncbi:MAG: ABC transporter ATP-binding protein [Methanobacteriaceae archaeon]|jgi:iron complex transport system ATP-binding protein
MKNVIGVTDATFSYNGSGNVFEDINLSVKKGNVICILGPNGSGKTTFIKCLNGLLKLKSGEILLNGQNIHSIGINELARQIGYIPQGHSPVFPFTALDVVLMGRAPHLSSLSSPSQKDYDIAREALEKLNIVHMMYKPYTNLSGGEKQLVFFARVFAQKSNILLLDEPTSHLDFGNQIRTLKIISNMAKEGLTVIMSSHFPDHAFMSADKVAIMKGKTIIDYGTPEEVITEKNLETTYGIKVKIIDYDDTRKICVPIG